MRGRWTGLSGMLLRAYYWWLRKELAKLKLARRCTVAFNVGYFKGKLEAVRAIEAVNASHGLDGKYEDSDGEFAEDTLEVLAEQWNEVARAEGLTILLPREPSRSE